MPTATTTVSTQGLLGDSAVLSLKPTKALAPAESSTAATLRSFYSRAANAFLRRDFALTHTLLTSAFALIAPPIQATEDEIATSRRKWDILRITVETAVYSSPSSGEGADTVPAALRTNQSLSPQSLVETFHARSLQLFTPSNPTQRPSSAFLPHQILHALVYSSLKLGCHDVGRRMIEDWLSRRPADLSTEGRGGYAKVLRLYCMEVLPRLEDWEYAQEFLQYEGELDVEARRNMIVELQELHRQAQEARQAQNSQSGSPRTVLAGTETGSNSSSRSVSPARSISSDSSTSTHTATPRTPNPAHGKGKERSKATNGTLNGLAHLTPSPALTPSPSSPTSSSAKSATTSKTVTPSSGERSRSRSRRDAANGRYASPAQNGDAVAVRSGAATPLRRPLSSSSAHVAVGTSSDCVPSTLALVRSSIKMALRNASKSKLVGLFLVFVMFPLISLALRIRRRHLRITQGAAGAADIVRRRLSSQSGSVAGGSIISAMWGEVVKVVTDTIRMGGGGLA